MFNGHLLKHNLLQLIIAAAIAILIYIYAVAQGFTLPMNFNVKPSKAISTNSTSAKPTITPTPHTANPSAPSKPSHPSVLLSTPLPTTAFPAAATFHASEKAQEVANVPLRLAEMTNEGGARAIENTQEVLTNTKKTIENLEEKIKLKENF